MKRNFSNESVANFLMRGKRALAGRIRGKLLFYLGTFANGSSSKIFFGTGLRMINSKALKLGERVNFGIMARLECHGQKETAETLIEIGNGTSFGDYCHIGAMTGIKIGKDVLGGSNILIVDHSHGSPSSDLTNKIKLAPRNRSLSSKGPITIHDNVWIGDNCVILSGVDIGEGAIIAANSVITANVEPFTLFIKR